MCSEEREGAFLAEPRTRRQLESLSAALQEMRDGPGFAFVGLQDWDGDGTWRWLSDQVDKFRHLEKKAAI